MDVFADKYNHCKKHMAMGFGFDCNPVDANGAFVPFDKNSPDNFKKTQENLRERFEMERGDE